MRAQRCTFAEFDDVNLRLCVPARHNCDREAGHAFFWLVRERQGQMQDGGADTMGH